MRARITIAVAVLMLTFAIQAQQVKDIYNELQQAKTVSAPAPAAAPAQDPTLGITVSKPMPAETKPSVVEQPASVSKPEVAEPSVVAKPVEPTPAVVETVKPSTTDETLETVAIASDASGKGTIKSGLISLSLKGVDLNSVVRLFSELSGANIIVPELEATSGASKVDVSLKNVEWKPALQAILDGQGLELYEKIAGADVYSIRKKLPAAEAIKSTRTFIFKNADIPQATEMIKGIVGDRGQVFAYPQGNAIVVKTTQEIMDDVAQVAERIDSPRQQVRIDARIMELSDGGDTHRGVAFTKANLNGSAVSSNPLRGLLGLTTDAGLPSTLDPAGTLTLSSADLEVMITALEEKNNARMVSSPRVIVANGETAKIEILDRIPKIKTTLTTTTGASSSTTDKTVEAKQDEDGTDPDTGRKRYVTYDFGIRLDVTPTVYSEENIGVKIVPIITREDAANTRQVLVGLNGSTPVYDKYYAVNEKRVNTTFMLGNKRTAVIGGLTETKDTQIERKVPLLGDIPVIRHLFMYKGTEKVQTENIIFVTVSLEDGQNFDVNKAVKQSPLTRKQLVRDENNQVVDDRAVELFKANSDSRIKDQSRVIERTEQAESHDRTLLAPVRKILRP